MKRHIANTRRQLGELSELSRKTDEAERRILAAAERQLDRVRARIADTRMNVLTDQEAAAEYQELVKERSRLTMVIAQARRHIGQ